MKFRWKIPAMGKKSSISIPVNWETHFPADVLKLGLELERSGAVLSWEPDFDGTGISAVVQGPDPKPYGLDVEWEVNKFGEESIDGFCDCPRVSNCEHVVAAMQAAANSLAGVPAATAAGP